MGRHFLLVFLVLSLFAVVGCSSPSEQAQKETVKQDQAAQKQDQVVIDQEAISSLKQYLYENFGGNGNAELKVSWYDLIKDVKVYTDGSEKWAVVKADIYPDDEGKAVAVKIARVILASDIVERVEVDNTEGYPLAQELR